MGIGSMFVLIALVCEILFGIINLDNNKFWGGTFLFVLFVAVVFQLCSAGLAVESAKTEVDSGFVEGPDNLYASQFFLYAAPMCTRVMLGLLKFKDMRKSNGGGE